MVIDLYKNFSNKLYKIQNSVVIRGISVEVFFNYLKFHLWKTPFHLGPRVKLTWCLVHLYSFYFLFCPNFTLQFVIGRCWRQVIDVCPQNDAKTTVKGIWFDLIIHKWPALFHMIDNNFYLVKWDFMSPFSYYFLTFQCYQGFL